jgi:glycosyltransferase involved in cell wall biosynthesis
MIDQDSVHLTIIGSGPLLEEYKEVIKELHLLNVTIVGQISQDELGTWYNAADVMLFPSLVEAFGISLVEAMACGCPVIAAKAYGPQEIVEDGVTGFLIDPQSPTQLAEKIKYFLDNPQYITKMGDLASKSVIFRYAEKNQELLNLYKSILSH